jgi:hypothetical protein
MVSTFSPAHTRFPDLMVRIGRDMLLNKAGAEITGWKWLSYRDHFKPGEIEPYSTFAKRSNMVASRQSSPQLRQQLINRFILNNARHTRRFSRLVLANGHTLGI